MYVKRRQWGLTLVETIIFMVIVGIAVLAVLRVISQNVKGSADPVLRKQAVAIAEGLMEEVRLSGFTYCDGADAAVLTATSAAGCSVAEGIGIEAGNARPFDNVNDYHSTGSYTTDVTGGALPSGYSATVAVANDGALGPTGSMVPSADALRITVTVTYSGGSVALEGYRTRYAPNHVPVTM